MNNKLLKNLSITFLANIISMLVSIISTLIIPKLMGTVEYGYWQLYIFYISYAGLLHLGLCDGVYLSYGGEEYSNLNFEKLRAQFWLLSLYSFVFCFVISVVGISISTDQNIKIIITLTCVGAFVHVLRTYLWLILQTTNRLKEYSQIVIVDRAVFVVGVSVIAITGHINFVSVIICDIIGRIVSLIIAICYTIKLVIGKIEFTKKVFSDLIDNIKAGSNLLIAGIASNFIIGFVRIGIQRNWDIEIFGKISLSLSVINMILSFISVASIVFFPVLKRMEEQKQLQLYRQLDLVLNLLTFFILIFAGVGSKFIEVWLPQYRESAYYMILLLPICVYESETSMLLNTYLKAFRLEKILMVVNAVIMVVSLAFSYISTSILNNLYVAIIGIDILVLLRTVVLKYVLKVKANCEGYKKIMFMEMMLFAIYIGGYLFLKVFSASIMYLLTYMIFVLLNIKEIFALNNSLKKIR